MGTRADFYVGRGEQAEWLGSLAFDGFPEEGHGARLRGITTEAAYRQAIRRLLTGLDHATTPDQGWPWPWPTSHTTDFAYAFDAGIVYVTCFGHGWQVLRDHLDDWPDSDERVPFPDMTAQQQITYGARSGVIWVVGGAADVSP